MDRKTAISRAKEKLERLPELSVCLNRVGFVRVMPWLDLVFAPSPDAVSDPHPCHIVTFTLKHRQLMAEYQGIKEFVDGGEDGKD